MPVNTFATNIFGKSIVFNSNTLDGYELPCGCWGTLHVCKIYILLGIKKDLRAGEMAQWLKALTALPEDPGSILSTHIAAHNYL